jgi:hypothetical protein
MDANAAIFVALRADEQIQKLSLQVKPVIFPGMSPI